MLRVSNSRTVRWLGLALEPDLSFGAWNYRIQMACWKSALIVFEAAKAAIEHFTQLKSVYVAMEPIDAPN